MKGPACPRGTCLITANPAEVLALSASLMKTLRAKPGPNAALTIAGYQEAPLCLYDKPSRTGGTAHETH